ncbi:uncharacterized protein MAM_04757 [Metarhizium album ARSEF 1941]|uniref:DUF6594 domain-containing protein n=1 Tax=Metarhizium album (strain ARSEF 1941) TaxID=1081103 RepID=A0A0B2WW92_METAS|nr:uncharacterized protein MAM_04757 [Metarhizium album ARSEF 1941]KHN97160.1 hypothetical protein MAM_04757 [Metarhizium album ARSEF 1941]
MSTVSETSELLQDAAVPSNSQNALNDWSSSSVMPSEAVSDTSENATDTQREPSPNLVKGSDDSVSLNHVSASSSSSLGITSPHSSPHVPIDKPFMSATVEDCFDEDDPMAQLDAADTPPSSFCVTTPPINEAPRSPSALDKEAESVKPETDMQEDEDEQPPCQVGSPDIPAPQNIHHVASQHRPSVMDYLISQGSAKTSASTSEASGPSSRRNADGHAWPDDGQIGGELRPNGESHVSGSHHGDDRKSQLSWNGHQPAFRLADGNPLRIHGDSRTEAPYVEGYAQRYNHGGSSAPRSTVSVPQSDIRPDQHARTFYSEFPNHLETMAPSGYQLLAAKLCGDAGGPPLVPIYRRFDALSHRLLLYMQDEIAELERQLVALETQDTAKRSYRGGVLPASRRQDRWVNPNLTDQKTEVLGHIGYKLSQYNQVLASFRKVQDIPVPTWRDIHMYKTYLTTSKLIADDETRFLDAENDLVSLSGPIQPADDFNVADDGPTPMPKAKEDQQLPPFFKDGGSSSTRAEQTTAQGPSDTVLVRLALSCMCVVFVPVITFAVVPNFMARMAIVIFVALSVGIMIEQCGLLPTVERHKLDWILYSSLYCGAMAVVAGTVK